MFTVPAGVSLRRADTVTLASSSRVDVKLYYAHICVTQPAQTTVVSSKSSADLARSQP